MEMSAQLHVPTDLPVWEIVSSVHWPGSWVGPRSFLGWPALRGMRIVCGWQHLICIKFWIRTRVESSKVSITVRYIRPEITCSSLQNGDLNSV